MDIRDIFKHQTSAPTQGEMLWASAATFQYQPLHPVVSESLIPETPKIHTDLQFLYILHTDQQCDYRSLFQSQPHRDLETREKNCHRRAASDHNALDEQLSPRRLLPQSKK